MLRKGYGLGAQAMAAGSFKAPLFTIGWPTAEFGAMGLEGAVRLGMRRELEAIADPAERDAGVRDAVAAAYERGKGLNMAAYFEIDDVIDPADSRRWIATLFDDPEPAWRHDRQAPALRRRLVTRPHSHCSHAPRSTTSWCSTRTPSREDRSSIARSSAGSSNATSFPHCSHSRWW